MSYILPKPPDTLLLPFIIVAEGYNDACFVDEILQFQKIENCNVGCPWKDMPKKLGSRNDLDTYLSGIVIAGSKQESTKTKGILVVIDADTKAAKRFEMAADALEANGFPRPSKPFSIESYNDFRVGVFIIPGEGRTGTLEHILLEATIKKNPAIGECIEQFSKCTGVIPTGTENQQAKMRMSCVAGAFCKDNPWASAGLLLKCKESPIPIDSKCFEAAREFIRAFCA